MTQVVEDLPHNCKALNSNLIFRETIQERRREGRREKEWEE
jgi:hypothetical protein